MQKTEEVKAAVKITREMIKNYLIQPSGCLQTSHYILDEKTRSHDGDVNVQ